MKAGIVVDGGKAEFVVEWSCDHEDCLAHDVHALMALDNYLHELRNRVSRNHSPAGFDIEIQPAETSG